jgi:hypothetical protein
VSLLVAVLVGLLNFWSGDLMLDYLRFRLDLWKLERSKRKIIKGYAADLAEARKRKAPRDEREGILHTERWELEAVDDEIAQLHTLYLLRKAHRLIIPIPKTDDGETWEVSKQFGYRLLTPKGMSDLRAAARAERKARREEWLVFVPMIGAVTGLMERLRRWLRCSRSDEGGCPHSPRSRSASRRGER